MYIHVLYMYNYVYGYKHVHVHTIMTVHVRFMLFQFLIDIARQKNSTPLPLIPEKFGPQLPPERYCLTANNYRIKDRKKTVRYIHVYAYLHSTCTCICIYMYSMFLFIPLV